MKTIWNIIKGNINLLKDFFTPLDKKSHFLASGWLFLMFILVTDNLNLTILFTVLVGLFKEFLDLKKGKNSVLEVIKDAVANVFGLGFAMVIWGFNESGFFNSIHSLLEELL